MKKIFYKAIYTCTVMALLLVAVLPVQAQFTNTTLETGGLYTALAKDANNNLYVTRAQAGTSGQYYEVVKYINGTGAPVTLYQNLSHAADEYPWGLAVASNGDVYVSTDFSAYSGAVIKLTNTNGTYSASTFMTGKYFTALAIDASDNLYTTEYNSGTLKYNVVKYPAGSVNGTVIYGTLTAGAGYSYPTGLAVSGNGNVFVTDAYSNDPSISDGGKVTKLTAPAYTATTVNSGNYTSSLAVDALGNLYCSENDGSGYKLVEYVNGAGSPVTILTPLHTNSFIYPWGIAVFNPYRIFVADGADGATGGKIIQLQSILPNTVTVAASGITMSKGTMNAVVNADGFDAKVSFVYSQSATLAGGITKPATVGATAFASGGDTNASLTLTGLTASTKYFYKVIATSSSGTTSGAILSFTTNGPVPVISYTTPVNLVVNNAATLAPTNTGGAVPNVQFAQVSTHAGSGSAGTTNGTGAAATFNNPFGVATDAAGNIYVSDHSGNTIRKVTPAGVVTTLAGSGAAGSANGAGTAATFSNPAGLAADAAGNVYVADFGNNMIRKITPTGIVTTVAGYGPAGSNNGAGASATFSGPAGVALDGSGNLYVADAANNLIRMIAPDGTVSTFAGSGSAGGTNGTGTAASFNNPQGIAADLSGNIYVAETTGNRIRKITPAAVVTTLAGSGAAGSANGTGVAASFKSPAGIAADVMGVIYVADGGNNMIRKITTGGVVTTFAGSTAAGTLNGFGTAAKFNSPHGLAIGGGTTVTLYIGDFNNNKLRRAMLTGYSIASALPDGLAFNGASGVISGTPTTVTPATDYTVTAFNVTGSGATTVNIQTSLNPALLTGLTVSSGSFDPAFSSYVYNYTMSVPYALANIKVTPTAVNAGATIKVNGAAVASGAASGDIALAVGDNIVSTVVTAPDGVTTKTYTLTVTRAMPSTNAVLNTIVLTPKITLQTTSGPGYRNYTVQIPNNVNSIQLTPTAQDPTAVIKIGAMTIPSATLSGPVPLSAGANTITIVVTAEDGVTVKDYIITAYKAPSLSNLALSSGIPNPVFDPATATYTANVTYATSAITVTPAAADAGSTITVNGYAVTSGSPSQSIPLNVGGNTVATVVTSADGTATQTYTLTVNRATQYASTNALLTTIVLTPKITLQTTTGPGYRNYVVPIPNNVSSIQITPTAQDATATITIGGMVVASATKSQSIPLNVGQNVITIVVTAEDGATIKNYIITATRAPSLSNLALSSGILSPSFASATTSYTATVTNVTTGITVTPTAGEAGSTVKVNGATVASGVASGNIPLAVGANAITTIVTSQDGTGTQTYTTTVTRAAANLSTNAVLSTIVLTPKITLQSTTGPGFRNYTVPIPNNVSSIQITPTAQDPTCSIKIGNMAVASGAKSGSIPLNVGQNIITIVVTAQDGATIKNYIITATRAPALSNLALSAGTLSPAFDAAATSYTAIVPNATSTIKVTPTVADAGETVTVNGIAVASGSASGSIALAAGSNVITTIVSSADGTAAQTYTTTVTRADASLSTNALLSTIVLTPKITLTVTSGPGYRNYVVTIPNDVASIQITPTAQDATATITIGGMTVASGTKSGAIPLTVGDNVITIVVTAQDGATVKNYIITATRQAAAPMVAKYVGEKPVNLRETNGISVHQGLSPNGDGDNDVLTIDGITSYPDNTLQIMSRSGELVYQTKGYDNKTKVFDGQSNINGKLQPAGTYFYSLDYKDGGETKHKTGFIVLKY